jgi:hypothetical protein
MAILDEIDSGLDIDALRDVATAVNGLKTPERSVLMVTHYRVSGDLRCVVQPLLQRSANGWQMQHVCNSTCRTGGQATAGSVAVLLSTALAMDWHMKSPRATWGVPLRCMRQAT